jgi:hypothetical protein
MTNLKTMAAQKENSSGIIPIFNESLTVLFQRFDTGRKSLSKSIKSKVAVATNEPSGTPVMVVIENVPEKIGLDEIKLASVFMTPYVDSPILQTNVYMI